MYRTFSLAKIVYARANGEYHFHSWTIAKDSYQLVLEPTDGANGPKAIHREISEMKFKRFFHVRPLRSTNGSKLRQFE